MVAEFRSEYENFGAGKELAKMAIEVTLDSFRFHCRFMATPFQASGGYSLQMKPETA